MYLVIKQQLKHRSKSEYKIIKELCCVAKNLKNQAIYNCRQYYFENKKYLSYNKNYDLLKTSENYRILNSNMAEQILKAVDRDFKSFFGLLKSARKGAYDFKGCKLPKYLPKDGYTTLIIGMVRIKDNKLVLPYSNLYRKSHKPIEITIPQILVGKTVKEIRIIPRSDARFFEIQYIYEAECTGRNLNKNNALAIDVGVNNLAAAVTNTGRSFIVDGKKLKSINQWYNKENARLQSVKDKQHYVGKTTKRQMLLTHKRNNRVNDYMSKAAKVIIDYCIENDIGTLVFGYNKGFQKNSDMSKSSNQNFVNIPYGKLKCKLIYLCELNEIQYIEQEESYTSKASFWDGDEIPTYEAGSAQEYIFSGKRICRGMYRCKNGQLLNADINGALNILKKCNVVSLNALYCRGEVDTPVRIRFA